MVETEDLTGFLPFLKNEVFLLLSHRMFFCEQYYWRNSQSFDTSAGQTSPFFQYVYYKIEGNG